MTPKLPSRPFEIGLLLLCFHSSFFCVVLMRFFTPFFLSFFFAQFVFGQVGLSHIKEYSKSSPGAVSRYPEKLAQYLTENESTEEQKILNIYTWIVYNIKYNLKRFNKLKTKNYSVRKILRRKKGLCFQYTTLFNALCSEVGISSKEIVGYSKGLSYFEGDRFFEADHSWNAVKLDSAWYLLDPTWGSGIAVPKSQKLKEMWYRIRKKPYIKVKYEFIQKPNFEYFLAKPEKFIENHLPADPSWQLITYPVSISSFQSKDWNEYPHKPDSFFKATIDSLEYREKLNAYEFLPEINYLLRTAQKAKEFNPKNDRILSEAQYSLGSAYRYNYGGRDQLVQKNQASIEHFKSAIQHANSHKKTVDREIGEMINANKKSVHFELTYPSKLAYNSTKSQLKTVNKNIPRLTQSLEKQSTQLTKLKDLIENLNDDSLRARRNQIQPEKEVYLQKKEQINHLLDTMAIFKDTANAIIKRLNLLSSRSRAMQMQIERLHLNLNEQIKEASITIEENQPLSKIIINTQLINREVELIDSLVKEFFKIEANISKFARLARKTHANIINQARSCQKLLAEIYPDSNEADFLQTSYIITQKGIENAYLVNFRIDSELYNLNRATLILARKKNTILTKQSELLNYHLKMIEAYQKWRKSGLLFKKKKARYQLNKIIDKCNSSVQHLNKENRNLLKGAQQK